MNNEKIKQQIETTESTIKTLVELKECLQKQLEKEPKPVRWRAKRGGNYYFLSAKGDLGCTYDGFYSEDNAHYNIANYYQTGEKVKAVANRQLAIVRVNDRIGELKNGLDIDDIDADFGWLICWSHREMKLVFSSFSADLKLTSVLRNIPNKRVAMQIIDECADDLKLILEEE